MKSARVLWDAERGVWYAQPYLGTSPDGRKIRPRRSFPDAKGETEAQALADEWVRNLTADGTVRSSLIVDMLWEYIANRAAKDVARNTVKRWRMYTRAYVGRYLKGWLVQELTAMELDAFEQRLLAPKERGGQGLCRNTVSSVHHFLSGAFGYWERVGLVDSNPMRSVQKPREYRHEAVALDEWDFSEVNSALMAALRPDEPDGRAMVQAAYAMAAWLALHTGMRLSEVCAVRRRDLNRRFGYVHVCGKLVEAEGGGVVYEDMTKSRRSRNVSLAPDEWAVINDFLSLQNRVFGALRPNAALVSAGGDFMRPGTVSAAFSRIRDRCGLPKACTFHSLRHTHATWCLANGVNLKTLSARLGHANEVITLRTYAHLLPGADEAAAQAFSSFAKGLEGDGGDRATPSANGVQTRGSNA